MKITTCLILLITLLFITSCKAATIKDPIIDDNFSFSDIGITKSYDVRTKVMIKSYEVGFSLDASIVDSLPSTQNRRPISNTDFGVKFNVEVYDKDKLLFNRTSGFSIISTDRMRTYFSVMILDLPYGKDLTVRVTLLEDRRAADAYRGPARLFVRVAQAYAGM